MNLPSISAKDWINSRALTGADFKGKVVLVDFWDYTCVNCIRTLPYIKEWWKRYKDNGLMIVGVHSPEFAFAEKRENVERAVQSFGIDYPVLLDNDFTIWRSFGNRFWPAKYLFDSYGRLRYYHFGEGEYQETEMVIQTLLREVMPKAQFPEIMKPIRDTDISGAVCHPVTPELYLGYERGSIGNAGRFQLESPFEFKAEAAEEDHSIYLDGRFSILRQSLRYEGSEKEGFGRLFLKYYGYELNLVLSPPENGEEGILEILQDGAPLPRNVLGEHAEIKDGFSLVRIRHPQMYNLVRNPDVQRHRLELRFLSPGIEAYAFTFTSCTMKQ